MRVALIETPLGDRLALQIGESFHALPLHSLDLRALLGAGVEFADKKFSRYVFALAGSPVRNGRMRAPLGPGKIVVVGLNYLDHVRNSGLPRPTEPQIITKFTSSVIGPFDEVRFDPALTSRVDWAAELAVVIGRRCYRISRGDAGRYVAGYMVANDITARDLQSADGQWVRGKSLDTFCPLGPVFVTAEEIADPQDLAIRTTVNGQVMQDSSTSEMIFGVAELIAFCSLSFTLEPGDLILTGTPWGCGEFMRPPRYLKEGDIVEVEIEGIGLLRNPIRHISSSSDLR